MAAAWPTMYYKARDSSLLDDCLSICMALFIGLDQVLALSWCMVKAGRTTRVRFLRLLQYLWVFSYF